MQEVRRGLMRLTGSGLAVVRNGRSVFSGLSFELAAGELLAVTGANGVGKSTLLRIVAGLLAPSAGRVSLEPATADSLASELHYLGHLDGLKTTLTVRRNLEFWRALWVGKAVELALEAVGLGNLADLPVGLLSAGQRRRLAIARLLIDERALWLLDEPATSLDAAGEQMLGRLIAAHLAAGGMAMVATHRELPLAATATLTLGTA
jgi:heme exporter protein A